MSNESRRQGKSLVSDLEQNVALLARESGSVGLMKAKLRRRADDPSISRQEGDRARRSACLWNVSVQVASMDDVSNLDSSFDVPARTIEAYDADIRSLCQCNAELLWNCLGKGARKF
jgi:hypothetical protein